MFLQTTFVLNFMILDSLNWPPTDSKLTKKNIISSAQKNSIKSKQFSNIFGGSEMPEEGQGASNLPPAVEYNFCVLMWILNLIIMITICILSLSIIWNKERIYILHVYHYKLQTTIFAIFKCSSLSHKQMYMRTQFQNNRNKFYLHCSNFVYCWPNLAIAITHTYK